jgi:hypothetical protein
MLTKVIEFSLPETSDHFIPRLDGFGDDGGFVLARCRNCGAELPADGTDHSVDDFVTPFAVRRVSRRTSASAPQVQCLFRTIQYRVL